MASGKIASWAFCEEIVDESRLFESPSVLADARALGSERALAPVHGGTGAHVRTTAALLGARSIIEVGCGAGVLGLFVASVMGADATLTTIDPEPANIRAVKEAFAAAGLSGGQLRTINGRALTVLPRLTAGAYDMVIVQAQHEEVQNLVDLALGLLRPGGALLVTNVLHHDRVADSSYTDSVTLSIRALISALEADERLAVSVSPVGDGVLTAVLRADRQA